MSYIFDIVNKPERFKPGNGQGATSRATVSRTPALQSNVNNKIPTRMVGILAMLWFRDRGNCADVLCSEIGEWRHRSAIQTRSAAEPFKTESFFFFFSFGSECAVPVLQNISNSLINIQLSRHELILQLKTHLATLTVQGINVTSFVRVLRCPSRGPSRSDVPPEKIPRAPTF